MGSTVSPATPIPALTPRGKGHQFVCYADCCSGIPDAPHEATFAAVNHVVARLSPRPDWICFPGDEIRGLAADQETLRRQWHYWFEHEMAWLDREAIPLYHTTGNHTTYDPSSEQVFREVLADVPRNGPPGQEGLSYWIRRQDLLMVFVNTTWSGLGDGRVETAWLDQTLAAHAEARYKLVLGHYPAFPINGFSGDYQRNLDTENRRAFWQVLVRHRVIAYLCSHIMAFDVQVHEGVLQIATAGAGTLPPMPEDVEYLHCVQAALDEEGLRYQVLDTSGRLREWLDWPLRVGPSDEWTPLDRGEQPAPQVDEPESNPLRARLVAWQFDGCFHSSPQGQAQTLLSGWTPGGLAPLWIGIHGPENRLYVLLSAGPGKSPHYWTGPLLTPEKPFTIQIALHDSMGPGGVLYRWNAASPWSSLTASSPWGPERLAWPARWSVGQDQYGPDGRPFRGEVRAKWWLQETEITKRCQLS